MTRAMVLILAISTLSGCAETYEYTRADGTIAQIRAKSDADAFKKVPSGVLMHKLAHTDPSMLYSQVGGY